MDVVQGCSPHHCAYGDVGRNNAVKCPGYTCPTCGWTCPVGGPEAQEGAPKVRTWNVKVSYDDSSLEATYDADSDATEDDVIESVLDAISVEVERGSASYNVRMSLSYSIEFTVEDDDGEYEDSDEVQESLLSGAIDFRDYVDLSYEDPSIDSVDVEQN